MKVLAVLLLAVAACQGAVYQRDNRPVVEEYVFRTEPVSHDVKSLLDQVFQNVETFPRDRKTVQDPDVRSKIAEYEFKKYRIPERYHEINMPYELRLIEDPSIRDVKMQTKDQFSIEGQKQQPSIFQYEREQEQTRRPSMDLYMTEGRQQTKRQYKDQEQKLRQIEQYQRDSKPFDKLNQEEIKLIVEQQYQKREPLSEIEQSKKLQQLKEIEKIQNQHLLRKEQEIEKLDKVLQKELQQKNDQQLEQVDKRMQHQSEQSKQRVNNDQWSRNDRDSTKTRDEPSRRVYQEVSEQLDKKEQIKQQRQQPSLSQHESIENIFQQQVPLSGHADMSRLFPAGEAILDMMLEQYPWYQTLKMENIKDFTGLNQTFLRKVVNVLPEVTKIVDQPTTLAVLYTKAVVKEVMYERLQCPAVVLDKILMRRAKKDLVKIMNRYNEINFRFLELSLNKVLDRSLVQQLSKDGASQMDQEVFYNTMYYIVSRHLGDVELLSHKLFTKFLTFFKKYMSNPHTDVTELSTIIQTTIQECDVKCPIGSKLNFVNEYVFWDVTHRFIPNSAESLTNRIERMFYRQIFNYFVSKGQPFPNEIFRFISEQMHPETFQLAKNYYRSGVDIIKDYEQVLIPREEANYMRYIEHLIKPEEKPIVLNVLKKLGWRFETETSKTQTQRQQKERN